MKRKCVIWKIKMWAAVSTACIHVCTDLQPSACTRPGCRSSSRSLHWAGRWWWWPTGSWQPAEHSLLSTAPHWSERHTNTENDFNIAQCIQVKVVPWTGHRGTNPAPRLRKCGKAACLDIKAAESCACLPYCQRFTIRCYIWKHSPRPKVCVLAWSDYVTSQPIPTNRLIALSAGKTALQGQTTGDCPYSLHLRLIAHTCWELEERRHGRERHV